MRTDNPICGSIYLSSVTSFPIERDGARHAVPARYGNWTENLVLLHLSPRKFGKYVDKVLPVGAVRCSG